MNAPPTCLTCAHHKRGFFGRHLCDARLYTDVVTGNSHTLIETCWSMRADVATFAAYGYGTAALCGSEGRLWVDADPHSGSGPQFIFATKFRGGG